MSDEGTEKNANILPVFWYIIKKNAFIKQVASNQRQRSNNVGMAIIGFSLVKSTWYWHLTVGRSRCALTFRQEMVEKLSE